MQTPDHTCFDKSAFDHVYEPSEDSYILIDAIEKDLENLKSKKPVFCLEVGTGSGVVITAVAMAVENCVFFGTDINIKACDMAKNLGVHSKVSIEAINMDLATDFINHKFDVIIFNPPYVVTDSSECNSRDISASWAGGVKGREVTDRLLNMIPEKLAEDGWLYLLLLEENKPIEVIGIMNDFGYESMMLHKRQVRNEVLSVYKFYK